MMSCAWSSSTPARKLHQNPAYMTIAGLGNSAARFVPAA
jgi:hypothetical protein